MIGIKVIEIEQNSTADLVILDENNNTEYLDSIINENKMKIVNYMWLVDTFRSGCIKNHDNYLINREEKKI